MPCILCFVSVYILTDENGCIFFHSLPSVDHNSVKNAKTDFVSQWSEHVKAKYAGL